MTWPIGTADAEARKALEAECVRLRRELAEARAALASATIDTWWAKAYFKNTRKRQHRIAEPNL